MWKNLKAFYLLDRSGVKIFRVDNPHTKSCGSGDGLLMKFTKHPDIIFLAEAFTRPKVMYQLAKRGFTQSYTYFTWRNTKWEITKYFEELIHTEARNFPAQPLAQYTRYPSRIPSGIGKSGFT
jgi:starch synthase (maltosyl-transferring)